MKSGDPENRWESGDMRENLSRQDKAEAFRREAGSLSCRELLGLPEEESGGELAERTEAYYASRPCLRLVKLAVRILEERYGGE